MKGLKIGVHVGGGDRAEDGRWHCGGGRSGHRVRVADGRRAGAGPFAVFGAAAQRTTKIMFGTWIVPTFPRHPLTMAQGAGGGGFAGAGANAAGRGAEPQAGGRGYVGDPFERPLEHLREYLTILKAILGEGSVEFDGKRLHAHGRIAGPTQVQVLASALRTNGFRVCGELADGAISWVCPLPYLRDVAVPAINEGAAKAGRTPPPLIAHVPVVVSEDVEGVRAGAARQIACPA